MKVTPSGDASPTTITHVNRKEAVVYLDRNELLLLSRGGRVPISSRPRPVPPLGPERTGPGRLATLVAGMRARVRRRPQLDAQKYLEMEFAVDDER
jgi:hypothetical protein